MVLPNGWWWQAALGQAGRRLTALTTQYRGRSERGEANMRAKQGNEQFKAGADQQGDGLAGA